MSATIDDINNNLLCKNHPIEELKSYATQWGFDLNSKEFVTELDKKNIYPNNRDKFLVPTLKDLPPIDLTLVENPDAECIYLCGNSLGLQPRNARDHIQKELDKWAKMGVYGHMEGDLPWATCEEFLRPQMAKIVGASMDEVNVLNFLTVNLHLMMISFYQPTDKRFKILLEDKAFPSDHYAVESQIKLHNLNPDDCMILIKPREGETYFRTEDIVKVIEDEGESLCLVLLSGLQYFTGQFFNIKTITAAAHKQGAYCGWDLAHAVGNCELKLNEWNVDFAAWCTYKYLNGGAGSIGGIFFHKKHHQNLSKFKKLDGWWSHRFETRFEMSNKMEYSKGAAAYGLSNTPMLLTSCLKSSLDIFESVGMPALRARSRVLTGYFEHILNELMKEIGNSDLFDIMTPTNPDERGSQLSLRFKSNLKKVHVELEKRGVVCDFREPNVLRFAPVALYTKFVEIHEFVQILKKALHIAHSQ